MMKGVVVVADRGVVAASRQIEEGAGLVLEEDAFDVQAPGVRVVRCDDRLRQETGVLGNGSLEKEVEFTELKLRVRTRKVRRMIVEIRETIEAHARIDRRLFLGRRGRARRGTSQFLHLLLKLFDAGRQPPDQVGVRRLRPQPKDR